MTLNSKEESALRDSAGMLLYPGISEAIENKVSNLLNQPLLEGDDLIDHFDRLKVTADEEADLIALTLSQKLSIEKTSIIENIRTLAAASIRTRAQIHKDAHEGKLNMAPTPLTTGESTIVLLDATTPNTVLGDTTSTEELRA